MLLAGGYLKLKTWHDINKKVSNSYETFTACLVSIHSIVFSSTLLYDHLGGVMFSVLASSKEGRGLIPSWVKLKTLKLVFAASQLSTQPRVRIMCLAKVACFPSDCCFRELVR